MLESQLEGLTLEQAITAKRLFYTDIEIMDNVKHRKGFEVSIYIRFKSILLVQ